MGSSWRLSTPEDLGEVTGGSGRRAGATRLSTRVGACLGVQGVSVAAATCGPVVQWLRASP